MRISRNAVMAAIAITVAVVATSLALALIESNTGTVTLIPARAAAAGRTGAAGQPATPGLTRHGSGQSGQSHGRHQPRHSQPGKPTPTPSTPASKPPRMNKREVGGRLLAASGIIVHEPHGSPRPPSVPASAYVIATAGGGQVLAAKDPHGLYAPASTLKVLTAITMLPRMTPNTLVRATKLAASVQPNIIGIIPGHKYRAADLFRALLMISANDAAVALAQSSGSFAKGVALMNAEAHHLQAYDVVAKQPNGLPATGQVVSAYDLALIARRALRMPLFMKYDAKLKSIFPVTSTKRVTMINQNSLLTGYRGGIGGKIGWTVKAGATYIGLASRNGVTLIVTILHATPLTEIASAEKLLNWGFAMDSKVRPVGMLVSPLRGEGAAARVAGTGHLAAGHLAAGHLAATTRAQHASATTRAQHAGTTTHTRHHATTTRAQHTGTTTRAGRLVTSADSQGRSGVSSHSDSGLPIVGIGAARIADDPYSYALTGQAWLRRARLVAAQPPG